LIIQTQGLSKSYGSFAALDRCDMTVEKGEVFGLLGPNGAGKTTLLRLLLGFLRPSHGAATIDGLDCYRESVEIHRRVSYLPGEVRLFSMMRGKGVLEYFAGVRGESPKGAIQLAERLDLDLTRRVAFMSTGMRQKLGLATALSAETPIVILDEPTSGLDPNVQAEVTRIVRERHEEGRTVLFSSHILSEVEDVCDRVVILRKGKLVHTQVMRELRSRHRIRARARTDLPPPPEELAARVHVAPDDDHVVIDVEDDLAPVMRWLAASPLEEIRIDPVGLRSVYAQYHAEAKPRALS